MWTLICVFKLPISVTNFVHSLQGCSFSPVCTLPKCSFKWQSCAKSLDIGYKEMDFLHVSFHMYFKTILCVKPFGHWLHWYSFSPVCILKCLFKKYLVWNPLHSNYSMISCWSGFLNVYWNEQFVRILLDICYNYMASRLYEFTDVFSNCILRKS